MLRVLAGLALVLVLFFLLLRGVKRLHPGFAAGRADFRVVASLALSTRERLLLVQVGEQQLLLGAVAQGLRCLHVLPQPLASRPPTAVGAAAVTPFAEWLRKARAARDSSDSSDSSASFTSSTSSTDSHRPS